MKDRPMELVLIILLLVVLLGGGFGYYRGSYYRQGGLLGIGGIGPGRPRDRVAGARAPRGPLSLSFESTSLVMA
jgi:hypothetical protein